MNDSYNANVINKTGAISHNTITILLKVKQLHNTTNLNNPYSHRKIATQKVGLIREPWWRHPMDAFSALLAICAGNSPVTGQWRRALIFSLICVWINGWLNNRETGDLRCHRAHYDVIVMIWFLLILVSCTFPHSLTITVSEWPANVAVMSIKAYSGADTACILKLSLQSGPPAVLTSLWVNCQQK